jgi:predicted RNA-binding protein (virulence factor B family)
MAIIGKRNKLTVLRGAPPGFYLEGGELGEILLPGRYAKSTKPGDVVDVFIYRDSEDRLVATPETPHAMVGDFSLLKVLSVNRQVGAFLDWGLAKDLLLPFREQIGSVHPGEWIVVFVYIDPKSERIVATMRLNKHLSHQKPDYKKGQEVEVLITSRTPLGYNTIVENTHHGLLYHSNLSGPLQVGARLKVFVHTVREDGKIDLRLDASGYKAKVGSLKDQVLQAIRDNGGQLNMDLKSSPESIRDAFGVSKNAFKLALSALYKERIIIFQESGVMLVKK